MPTVEKSASEAPGVRAGEEIINDRFRVVRYLGRGGMGDVCLVRDGLQAGCFLALKRLRKDKIEPRTVAILRNEFLALSSLSHPNLIRAFDFGVDRSTGDLFFTEEFVQGCGWLEASRGADFRSPEGLEKLLGVLAQVLRALEFIHAHGLVHGDVKPENVLVTQAESAEAVKVIDFGLVRKQGAPREEKILGTPYYVPPETILGAPADSRSDLYSLGAVLYHICTGRPPFAGDSNLAILRCHLEKAPVPPQEVMRGLDPKLGELILRLLEKKPEARFDSALAVIEHLNGIFAAAIPLETQETSEAYLKTGTVVGREQERIEIHKAFGQALGFDAVSMASIMDSPGQGGWPSYAAEVEASSLGAPPGRLLLLTGEKGLGKKRVVRELKTIAETLGARFLSVDCAEHHESGSGGLEALLGQLTRFDWPGWSQGLPPRLQSALLLRNASPGTAQETEQGETKAALRELALALLEASQDQPVVLYFQDLHFACEAVADFLGGLVEAAGERAGSPRRFLAFGVCPDRGAIQAGAFLRLWDQESFRESILEIRLPRLTERTIVPFVGSLLPGIEFPPEFGLRVLEESDGNPEVVLSILGHLIRTRNIRRRVLGWDLVGDYQNQDFPGKSRGALGERLSKLPPEAVRLARAFACLGERANLGFAARLADMPLKTAVASASLLAAERIVQRFDDPREREIYAFVHSSWRSFVYRSMEEEERRRYHRLAGELLERRGAGDRELAAHFLAAWDVERGLRYGLSAARGLRQGASLADAAAVYEQVYSVALPAGTELAVEVAWELARVRFGLGDYVGILELHSSVTSALGSPRSAIRLRILAARAAARLGQMERCRLLLEGLHQAGGGSERQAAALAAAEAHLLEDRFVEALRICRGLLGGPELADRDLGIWLHALAAEGCLALEHREEAASHCQLVSRLLDAEAESEGLSTAFFWRGKYYACQSQLEKAKKQFRLSLLMARRCSAFGVCADALYELGRIEYRQERDEEAASALEEALKTYRQQGHRSRARWSAVFLAEVKRRAGDRVRCGELLREALSEARGSKAGRIAAESFLALAFMANDGADRKKAGEYLRRAKAAAGRSNSSKALLRARALECEMCLEPGDFRGALDSAAKGLLFSREIEDVEFEAHFQLLQAKLYSLLGAEARAKKALVAAFDLSERYDLVAIKPEGLLVQAKMLSRRGEHSAAQALFSTAKHLVTGLGSRRALMALQHEHGAACVAQRRYEDAYLELEEGLHVATALERHYEMCLFHSAMGKLEFAIDPSGAGRALHHLSEAARIAMERGYRDLLWRVQLQTYEVFRKAGWEEKAQVQAAAARRTFDRLLASIPPEYRDSFIEAASVEEGFDLKELLGHVSGAATHSGIAHSETRRRGS